MNLSADAIEKLITQSYKEPKRCQQLAVSLSLEYRTKLAVAKKEAGEMKAATCLRSLNNIEASRTLFKKIQHIVGKTREGPTRQVQIINEDGSITTLTKKGY